MDRWMDSIVIMQSRMKENGSHHYPKPHKGPSILLYVVWCPVTTLPTYPSNPNVRALTWVCCDLVQVLAQVTYFLLSTFPSLWTNRLPPFIFGIILTLILLRWSYTPRVLPYWSFVFGFFAIYWLRLAAIGLRDALSALLQHTVQVLFTH